MDGLFNLVMVTQREYGEAFAQCFHEAGCRGITACLCEGTAQQKTLDRLGIEKTEKVMFSCLLPGSQAGSLLRRLRREMQLDVPGNGIGYLVALHSAAAQGGLTRWPQQAQQSNGTEMTQMEEPRFALIVAVVRRGCTDEIMDAARAAGATGGTIVHARGAAEKAGSFFGMSITSEKELLYIVARRADEGGIMRAIAAHGARHTGTL